MTHRPLHIGVCCYPTIGGSGIIATELARALANRGHAVHVISYERPRRLQAQAGVTFHPVVVPDYPVFHGAPYVLALASKLVDVVQRHGLDLIHAHYALPHAASAFLARSILGETSPPFITTLHGTDVTLVGRHESYLPVTRFALQQSAAVTAPSQWLQGAAREHFALGDATPVEVIGNFVDVQRMCPLAPALRSDPVAWAAHQRAVHQLFADDDPPRDADGGAGGAVIAYVSNFRPVKRTGDVVEVFARVARATNARLLCMGDGPDRAGAEARVAELGLASRVRFVGQQDQVDDLLRCADLLLLPSESESFGLAALEAASCGLPVVATDVGGLPEVVDHGVTGLLAPVGDLDTLTAHVTALVRDPERCAAMGRAGRQVVCARFDIGPATDRYEALYRRVLSAQ